MVPREDVKMAVIADIGIKVTAATRHRDAPQKTGVSSVIIRTLR